MLHFRVALNLIFSVCEHCEEEHHHGICPVNGSAILITDKQADQMVPDLSVHFPTKNIVYHALNNHAARTLPEGLELRTSMILGAGIGVWTTKKFKKSMVFGPYGGVKVYSEARAHKSGYTWEVMPN